MPQCTGRDSRVELHSNARLALTPKVLLQSRVATAPDQSVQRVLYDHLLLEVTRTPSRTGLGTYARLAGSQGIPVKVTLFRLILLNQ